LEHNGINQQALNLLELDDMGYWQPASPTQSDLTTNLAAEYDLRGSLA